MKNVGPGNQTVVSVAEFEAPHLLHDRVLTASLILLSEGKTWWVNGVDEWHSYTTETNPGADIIEISSGPEKRALINSSTHADGRQVATKLGLGLRNGRVPIEHTATFQKTSTRGNSWTLVRDKNTFIFSQVTSVSLYILYHSLQSKFFKGFQMTKFIATMRRW